jgi:hypothetical protein
MKQATHTPVLSPSSAAETLGVTSQYIRLLCRQNNIGQKLDSSGSAWVLYPEHVAQLRKILDSLPPRRPRISKVS